MNLEPHQWPADAMMTIGEKLSAEEVIQHHNLTDSQQQEVRQRVGRHPDYAPYWAYHTANRICAEVARRLIPPKAPQSAAP